MKSMLITVALFVFALLAVAQQTPPPKGVVDVTARVQALVRDNALEVAATTALAGQEPARKIVKKLVVIYTTGDADRSATATEGQKVKIAAPPGKSLVVKKAFYGDIDPKLDVSERLLLPRAAKDGGARACSAKGR